MKMFTKANLRDIPVEAAHGGSGSRQMLIKPEDVKSGHWEAVTKGFLNAGSVFDWHNHEGIDEVFIVTRGSGKIYCEDEETEYGVDDVVTIPAGLNHKIEAAEDSDFFFTRIKV